MLTLPFRNLIQLADGGWGGLTLGGCGAVIVNIINPSSGWSVGSRFCAIHGVSLSFTPPIHLSVMILHLAQFTSCLSLSVLLALGVSGLQAAPAAPKVVLTPQEQKFEAQYTAKLTSLQADITKALLV